MQNNDLELRFGGVQRLLGKEAFRRITRAHVLIVGIGGVGSWVAEAMVRTGVGHLTLVDFDDICLSNSNRQIHTTESTVGQPKTKVLAERIRSINENCRVHLIDTLFTHEAVGEVFSQTYDCVIDCIDQARNKAHLVVACRERHTPIVVSGSAGGIKDPAKIRLEDLARTHDDQLLASLRSHLRRHHGFPRGKEKLGIPTVYSIEKPTLPEACAADEVESTRGAMDCRTGYGTLMMVTATFGLFAASAAVDILINSSKS